MNVPTWLWWSTIIVIALFLVVDVFYVGRSPREPTLKECAWHLALYVGLAVMFGLAVTAIWGHEHGLAYFAGWLTEYSLSVDNLFVFIVIMSRFAVPRHLQQTALLVGIVLALIMRGIFIAVGAAAIDAFSWVFYIFGAFLVYTAVKIGRQGTSGPEDFHENAVLRWVRRTLPSTRAYHGTKLVVRLGDQRLITPMLIVIIALGTTDLLFAMDSIPAIYGLTHEPYLVLTANLFALMGLRQLYFLIGGLLERLVYLNIGLAVLLGFIGVKLVGEALRHNELPFINGGEPVHWLPEIPIAASLGIIVLVLAVTTVASLIREPSRRPAR